MEALGSIVEYAKRKRRFVAKRIGRQQDFNAVIVNHVNGSHHLSRLSQTPDTAEEKADKTKSSTCPAAEPKLRQSTVVQGTGRPSPMTPVPCAVEPPSNSRNGDAASCTTRDPMPDGDCPERPETAAQPEEEPVPVQREPTLRPVLSEGVLPPDLMRAISAGLLPDASENPPAPPPLEPQSQVAPPAENPTLLVNNSAVELVGQDGGGEVVGSKAEDNSDPEGTLAMIPSKVAFEPADVDMQPVGFRGSRTKLLSSSSRSLSASQRLFRTAAMAATAATDVANWQSKKVSNQYSAAAAGSKQAQAGKSESKVRLMEGEENMLTNQQKSTSSSAPPSDHKPHWGFASNLTGRRVAKPKPRYRHELLSDHPVLLTRNSKANHLSKHQAQWFEQCDDDEEAHGASSSPVQQQRFQDDEHFLQQEQMLLFLQQQERQVAMIRHWEQQQVLRQQQQLQEEMQSQQSARQRKKKFQVLRTKPLSTNGHNQIARNSDDCPQEVVESSVDVGPNRPPVNGEEFQERVEVSQISEQSTSRLGLAERINMSSQVGSSGGSAWWADQKPNLLGNRGKWRAPRLWAVGK